MKNVKNCVKKFKKDNKLLIPNWGIITEISRKNNWLLLPYSAAEKLIQEHNLEDVVNKHRAFTYEYFGEIIILYRDDLQEYSKLHAVCHEIGHICLEHTLNISKDDNSQQEAEADRFADLLLNWHKKALAVASVMVITLSSLILGIYTLFNETENTNKIIPETITTTTPISEARTALITTLQITTTTTTVTNATLSETTTIVAATEESTQPVLYYVSHSGSKYHTADCYHIDVDECAALTLEEIQKLGYEPCKTCRPDKIK